MLCVILLSFFFFCERRYSFLTFRETFSRLICLFFLSPPLFHRSHANENVEDRSQRNTKTRDRESVEIISADQEIFLVFNTPRQKEVSLIVSRGNFRGRWTRQSGDWLDLGLNFFGGFRFPWISDKDRHRVFGVGPLAHFRQVIIDADKGQGGTVIQVLYLELYGAELAILADPSIDRTESDMCTPVELLSRIRIYTYDRKKNNNKKRTQQSFTQEARNKVSVRVKCQDVHYKTSSTGCYIKCKPGKHKQHKTRFW